MKVKTLVFIALLIFVAFIVYLNWPAITAPTMLSLLVADIEAPLGILMLAIVVLMTCIFLSAIVMMQVGFNTERQRLTKALEAQRLLANEAETSRIHALREFLQTSFAHINTTIEESSNSLSASIGEFEDRLERKIDKK
jgi:uncharacterized integral membrane protein